MEVQANYGGGEVVILMGVGWGEEQPGFPEG